MPRVAGALGLALALACLLGLANPLVAPQRALACSCAAGARLADVVDSPDVAVFTGVVGARLADRVPVAVHEWFIGPDVADVVWLRPAAIFLGDGSVRSNTCGLTLAAGGVAGVAWSVAPASGQAPAAAQTELSLWYHGAGNEVEGEIRLA